MQRVLYLGPEGTYSHEAALNRFGVEAQLVPCLSLYDLFERLCEDGDEHLLAIVPVENSTEGPVTQTLDQLALHEKVTITESLTLSVRHHLMRLKGESGLAGIRRVYSHPQALGQCRASLRKLLPEAELLPESSTAAAARRAAGDPESAALASQAAAGLNGLDICEYDMQDGRENITRFFVLSAGRWADGGEVKGGAVRSMVHLVIGDRPGALLRALSPFDAAGVNMTFIQSRPLPGRPWEYGFFIEVVTDWSTAPSEAAWNLVVALAESGRRIGTYPVG